MPALGSVARTLSLRDHYEACYGCDSPFDSGPRPDSEDLFISRDLPLPSSFNASSSSSPMEDSASVSLKLDRDWSPALSLLSTSDSVCLRDRVCPATGREAACYRKRQWCFERSTTNSSSLFARLSGRGRAPSSDGAFSRQHLELSARLSALAGFVQGVGTARHSVLRVFGGVAPSRYAPLLTR